MTPTKDAFTEIAETKSTFVSRGDGSGTETKELGYWKAAGITPEGAWYIEPGQGMAATLQVASEKEGYTLTDIATWLATKEQLDLEASSTDDPSLLNIVPRHPGQPGEVPEGQRGGRQGLRRLPALAGGAGDDRGVRRGRVRAAALHPRRREDAATSISACDRRTVWARGRVETGLRTREPSR